MQSSEIRFEVRSHYLIDWLAYQRSQLQLTKLDRANFKTNFGTLRNEIKFRKKRNEIEIVNMMMEERQHVNMSRRRNSLNRRCYQDFKVRVRFEKASRG